VSYSDRVTVLRDGSHVAHLTGEAVNEQRVLAAIAAD
jgi:simple sugar transport system ATP-binding protein